MDNQAASNPSSSTPVPTTDQPVLSSPSQNTVKKTSRFSIKAIIGTIIFLLLAGGAAAGYVYKEQITLLVVKPTPTPTVTPTPTPTPQVPSDWLAFEDKETGISFKYPKDYTVEAENSDNILASVVSPLDPNKTKTFDVNENELKLEILLPQPTEKTLPEVITEAKESPSERISDPSEYKEKNIVVDGQEAISLTTRFSEVIYILRNNQIIRIVKYPSETYRQGEFDQMLSTFKFNKPQAIDTTNWKTHTNKKFGFSFKHPTDWTVTDNSFDQPDYKLAGVNVASVKKFDLKGYEIIGYNYSIGMNFDTNEPRITFQGFIKGYEQGDQATENVEVTKEFTEKSSEYKIAQEIFNSAKKISN